MLEDRHGRASTLMVSQLPVSSWHDVIGEPTIADAICDRLVPGAHRINLEGESVRKLYAQRANRDSAEPQGDTPRFAVGTPVARRPPHRSVRAR